MSEELTPRTLPVVPDALVDRMEDEIFASIAHDRRDALARRRRRRGVVGWTAAAAAAVVVGAVALPAVLGGGSGDVSASAPDLAAVSSAEGGAEAQLKSADASAFAGDAAAPATAQVITTATVDLRVDDVSAAASALASYAEGAGGFVESQSIGASGAATAAEGDAANMTYPAYSYVTLRIPADALSAAQAAIAAEGTVLGTTVNRSDVTTTVIDLEAQVSSAQASVNRLTELIASASSVTDLIAAETALADRTALLESYQQQLSYLENQVAMSTITVNLTQKSTASADPGGFASGMEAGWNGLVASLNAVVVALGFALPWLGVVAVIALVAWAIARARRARPKARDGLDG